MKTNIKKRELILGMISLFLLTACSKDNGSGTPEVLIKEKQEKIINLAKEAKAKIEEKLTVPEELKNNPNLEAKEVSKEIETKKPLVSGIFANFLLFEEHIENSQATFNNTARGTSSRSPNNLFNGYTELKKYRWEKFHEPSGKTSIFVYTSYESSDNYGFELTHNDLLFITAVMKKDLSYAEMNIHDTKDSSLINMTIKAWVNDEYWKIDVNNKDYKERSVIQVNTDKSGYWERYYNDNDAWYDKREWNADGTGTYTWIEDGKTYTETFDESGKNNNPKNAANFARRLREKIKRKFVTPRALEDNSSEKAGEIPIKIVLWRAILSAEIDYILEYERYQIDSQATINNAAHNISSRSSIFNGYTEIKKYKWIDEGYTVEHILYGSSDNFGGEIEISHGTPESYIRSKTYIMKKDMSYMEINDFPNRRVSDISKLWMNDEYWKIEVDKIVDHGKTQHNKLIFQVNADGSGYLEGYMDYMDDTSLWTEQYKWNSEGHGVHKEKVNNKLNTSSF